MSLFEGFQGINWGTSEKLIRNKGYQNILDKKQPLAIYQKFDKVQNRLSIGQVPIESISLRYEKINSTSEKIFTSFMISHKDLKVEVLKQHIMTLLRDAIIKQVPSKEGEQYLAVEKNTKKEVKLLFERSNIHILGPL